MPPLNEIEDLSRYNFCDVIFSNPKLDFHAVCQGIECSELDLM